MRAILDCEMVNDGEIVDILEKCHWLPARGVEQKHIDHQKELIISSLPEDIHERVRSTIKCVVFDRSTETWGIVTEEQSGLLTFRLKNPDSDKLRKATDRLVEELDRYSAQNNNCLVLPEQIQVLQVGTSHLAFNGKIVLLREGTFRFALREKQTEARIIAAAGLTFTFLLIVTFPYIRKPVEELLKSWSTIDGPLFATWIFGNFDRFTTSMLTTIVVALLQIAFYYSSIRQRVARGKGKATFVRWNE